jgi:hypothetical protein
MSHKSLQERQTQTDEPGGYVERLERYFRSLWPQAEITRVTAVVIGHRFGTRPGDPPLEVSFSITIHSKFAIPHALDGKSVGKAGKPDRFTFVQLGNSVQTNSYSTAIMGTYTGSDPPTEPPG